MIGYRRNIFDDIAKNIENDQIILLTGPRQSGKTTLLKQLQENLASKSLPVFFLNLEDPSHLEILNQHPNNLFKIFPIDRSKKSFVFIDEIQYLKNPTNFLKYIFDEYKNTLKLVVSGSSAFYIDKKFKDSLAGRKKIFELRTLSFFEFLRFKNREELANKYSSLSLVEKEETQNLYDEYLTYGGYPRIVLAAQGEKIALLQELAFSYVKKDILEANLKQDEYVYKLLKILAAQVGGLVNANELARTIGLAKSTIDNYLYVLQKSFLVAILRPFYNNIRKELTKMPKAFFYDLGLRNFFCNDFAPPITRKDLGALLENAVFRQLLDHSQASDEIKFWRTPQKNEIDFVVQGKTAYEVKVDASAYRPSKYKQFTALYPNIKINLVAYKSSSKHPALKPMEI